MLLNFNFELIVSRFLFAKGDQSPTVALNTWTAKHHIPIRYVLLHEEHLPRSINSSSIHPRQIFYYRLYFGQHFYCDGYGSSYHQARTNCAWYALNYIYQNQEAIMQSIQSTSSQVRFYLLSIYLLKIFLIKIQQKSPISLMYERAQRLGLSVHVERNEPLTITYVIGEQYSTTGSGSTKQAAKQIAAEKMLEILPLPKEKSKHNRKHDRQHQKFIEQKASNDYSLSEQINPITRLYQIARARNIKVEFHELDYLSNEKLFHFHVKFDEHDVADGYGKSKRLAKRLAAENLLSKIYPDVLKSIDSSVLLPRKSLLKRDECINKQQETKHVHFGHDEIIPYEQTSISNSQLSTKIEQQLRNACQKLNIYIQYDNQILNNDDNQYESILTLSNDDRLLAKFCAYAPSIILAKEKVSFTAWKNLQQLFNGSIQIPKTTVNRSHRQLSISSIPQQTRMNNN